MSNASVKMVALIPARAGSKRCPRKNTRFLAGWPLIGYALTAAIGSGVFSEIIVSTDDELVSDLVCHPDVKRHWRLPEHATDTSPDVEWVREALKLTDAPAFAILRPTSPFRTAATIRRAYDQFLKSECHSLRAVEPAAQHPGKMWLWDGPGMPIKPVLNERRPDGTPWHSSPTQTLPTVYVQNASLEMAWTYVLKGFGTISGTKVIPFFTDGYEGFDINTEADFARAEQIAQEHPECLPLSCAPRS